MNPLDLSAAQNRWSRHPAAEKLVLYGGLLLCAMVLPPRTAAPLVLLAVAVATLVFARVRPRLFVLALIGPAVFIALGSVPIAVGLRGGRISSPEDSTSRSTPHCARSRPRQRPSGWQ